MGKVEWEGAEPVYRTVIGAVVGLYKVMNWKVRVFDSHHIPRNGPVVIASNHVGYLDFTFIGYGAREQGRLVRFMAKEEVFRHTVAGPLMRAMEHIPVDRYGDAYQAVKDSVLRLEEGQAVGMFPEGTISPSFVPREGKTGAARMAIQSGAVLVPAATWGTQRILTKGREPNWQRGVAVDVRYGAPIEHRPDSDPEEVTERLMSSIRTLVDRAWEEYPQEPDGPEDRWWLPAHLGGTAPTPEEAEEHLREKREEQRQKRLERDD
jgi:1-acyl-sn-glycerol-3-phosphate acyltransferase